LDIVIFCSTVIFYTAYLFNLMEDLHGIIKYQSIDDNGLYTWLRKKCLLHCEKRMLEMESFDENLSDKAVILLDGAKYAKEWSFSSALSGFGFDILWESGKVWSFLVDKETDCTEWVKQLNNSINSKIVSDQGYSKSELCDTHSTVHTNLLNQHKEFLCQTTENQLPNIPSLSASIATNNHEFSLQSQNFQYLNSSNESTALDAVDIARSASPRITTAKPLMQSDKAVDQKPFFKQFQIESDYIRKEAVSEILDSTLPATNQLNKHQTRAEMNNNSTNASSANIARSGTVSNSKTYSQFSSSMRSIATEHENFDIPMEKSNIDNLDTTINLSSANKLFGSTLKSSSIPKFSHFSANTPTTSSQALFTEPTIKSLDTIYTYQALLKSLQTRCEDNESQLERQKHNYEQSLNELKEKLISAQSQIRCLDDENSQLHKQIQDISIRKQQDIKDELFRARNENYAFYESNIKSIEIQHQREMQCMQDELYQLRKQFGQEKDSLLALKMKQEETLQKYSSELEFYRSKLSLSETQLQTLQQSKTIYEEQSLQRIQQIVDQYETKSQAQHQLFHSQLSQIQQQHEDKLQKTIVETEEQQLKQYQRQQALLQEELEHRHLQTIQILQQQHTQQLEQTKTQQLQLHLHELENIKATFFQREQQISQDLLLLEKLHSERIQSYEQQLQDKIQTIQELQNKFAQNLLHSDIKEHNSLSQYQDLHKKFTQLQLDYHDIYNNKLLVQQNYDILHNQFSNLKQQAIEAITNTKLLKHENGDLQNSLSESRNSLMQYENVVVPQSEEYQKQLVQQLRILQEENQMLEHELSRFKTEMNHFQQQCSYLETLVYGIPQHSNNSQQIKQPSNLESTVKAAIPGNCCEYCSDRYRYPPFRSTGERSLNSVEKRDYKKPTHSVSQSINYSTVSKKKE